MPILKKNTDSDAVLAAADALAAAAKAAGIRAKVDAGSEKTPGFKFAFWEMKVGLIRVWCRSGARPMLECGADETLDIVGHTAAW